LGFELGQVFQDIARRGVLGFFMEDFFVAVEGEIVALAGDVGFGDAEGLGRP
jgi:hypothetical protein